MSNYLLTLRKSSLVLALVASLFLVFAAGLTARVQADHETCAQRGPDTRAGCIQSHKDAEFKRCASLQNTTASDNCFIDANQHYGQTSTDPNNPDPSSPGSGGSTPSGPVSTTLPGTVDLPRAGLTPKSIASALRIVFAVAGGIAVLIITVAAFRYVISQGDSQSTAKAKNAIISALIGLFVCIMAVAVTGYVLGKL